ncbi:type I-E CRISPR-associated protein Cas6/Cse3/CasE [Streptomyces sp. NPDC001054]
MTVFLTRFRLNPARVGARRLLGSPQSLHAAVLASFAEPPQQRPDGSRVLWRVDQQARSEVVLYVVSPDEPDLTHLAEQAGWPTTGGWQTRPYGTFLDRITADDVWAFRLTANPVHSIRRTPAEPTKRTAHVTPRHQVEWLLNRQEDAGFAVLEKPEPCEDLPPIDAYEVTAHSRKDLMFQKRGEKDTRTHQVKLSRVTFDGRLRVLDPAAFRRTLTSGLGKAKAYGCGLMTLARTE